MDLVPEEAIKAAADGIRESDLTAPRPGPLAALAYGRAALEAAAPLILAAELDRTLSAADGLSLTELFDHLRSRASVLRGEGDPK